MDRALLIGRIIIIIISSKIYHKVCGTKTENESEINLWNAGKYF